MIEGGNLLQDVLDSAAARHDRTIVWKYPDRPKEGVTSWDAIMSRTLGVVLISGMIRDTWGWGQIRCLSADAAGYQTTLIAAWAVQHLVEQRGHARRCPVLGRLRDRKWEI